ncbi:MAG: hypothetical protein OK455_07345 [Thaumarchaeota archaeon]|nr:hypothetical protein [Nitrososphaerota archaeon]
MSIVYGATATTTVAGITMTISTDKPSYTGAATIFISGTVSSGSSAVTLTVTDPNGNAVGGGPLGIASNGTFSTSIQAGGRGWSTNGTYTATAILQQPDNVAAAPTVSTKFTYLAVPGITSTISGSNGASQSASQSASGNGTANANNLIIGAGFVVLVVILGVVALGLMLRRRSRRTLPSR